MTTSADTVSTNWVAIWALFLSGCTLAVHVGKFPAALPLLIDEFELTLSQTGNLVSIYALLIALCALVVGVIVARIGYITFATAGVALCMLGSFAGAFATTITEIMLTRVFEGLGWLAGVVALPTLLSTLARPRDRPVVMGLWGAFMPIGAGSMLMLAPALQTLGGWRLSWMIASGLSLLGVITIILICRQQRDALHQLRSIRSAGNFGDLRQRESFAVMLCFLCYSFQYVLVTAYLPTLLIQDSGMLLARASYWAAVVMLANAIGSVAAGWLINAGIKRYQILTSAALLMGLFASITLCVPITLVRIMAAIMMAVVGGVIPGTLFSTAALVASSASGVGIIIGFMLTGTGIGQLLGPIALTRLVDWTGNWYSGGLLSLFVGVLGAAFARWLIRLPVVTKKLVS